MSGSDVLYISQLESHLDAAKNNRLTLGGLISKLGDDSPIPAKVDYQSSLASMYSLYTPWQHEPKHTARTSRGESKKAGERIGADCMEEDPRSGLSMWQLYIDDVLLEKLSIQ